MQNCTPAAFLMIRASLLPSRAPKHAVLIALLAASGLPAQIVAPMGIVRGELVRWEGTGSKGELAVKAPDARILTCTFDVKTYFEMDNQRITAPAMKPGDHVEIVADRRAGSEVCYARTVRVIDDTLARKAPGTRSRTHEASDPTERFAPRGDLTYAGLVMRIDSNVLVLKTRTDGEKMLLLRPDTRYIGEGMRVNPSTLKAQTRVFIRAGKNFEGDVEAYSVVWGDIVNPR